MYIYMYICTYVYMDDLSCVNVRSTCTRKCTYEHMNKHANPHHTNTHAHYSITQQVTCDDFATWSTLTHKCTQFTHIHCWRQGETSPPRTKREIQVWTDNRSFRQVCRPSCRRGTMRGASRKSRAVAKGQRRIFHWKWNLSFVQPIAFSVTICLV